MSGNVLTFPGSNPNGYLSVPVSVRLMAAAVPLMMAALLILSNSQVMTMTIMMMLLYVIYIRKRKSPLMYILLSVFLILNLMAFMSALPILPLYILWLGALYGLLKSFRTEPKSSEYIRVHLLQVIATFGIIILVMMLWQQLYSLVFYALKLFHVHTILKFSLVEGLPLDTAIFYLLVLVALYPICLLVALPLFGKKPNIPVISKLCQSWAI
jgi:hypothetical protein